MAAMVTEGTAPLQVALAHLFFNISGIVIWYPIPFMRRVPLYAARRLGSATRIWRGFPLVYIAVMFFLVPMVFLGISFLFEEGSKGYTALASVIVVILGLLLIWLFYFCQFKGGRHKCAECMAARERRRLTMKALPDDLAYLKAKLNALIEHTGLPDDEEDDEEEQQLLPAEPEEDKKASNTEEEEEDDDDEVEA